VCRLTTKSDHKTSQLFEEKGEIMSSRQSRVAEELAKFARVAWFDLPLAAAKRMLGADDEKNLTEAAWKAYDAWVRLANEATNELYSSRLFGDLTGRTMESALRAQQVSDAVASAFFGNLWSAVGLPTAREIQALRDEMTLLREESRFDADTRRKPAQAEQSLSNAHPASPEDGLYVVRNGAVAQTLRPAEEEKERAAA
jgi:hypothetical protein